MNSLKAVFVLACSIFVISGCLGNTDSDPIEVDGPAGSADYYINNQSGVDFNIVYTKMWAQAADTFKTISADSSAKFLRDSIFGNNPTPSTSFSKIVFYKGDPDTSSAIFTIDPVEDATWNITEEKGFEGSKYGFRIYELVITDEDVQ